MTLTRDSSFYKSIFNISLPIATQNLITFAISMVDTIMLGRLGKISLSASAIGNNIFFILVVIIFGVGSASSVMGSQYFGKKDIKSIHKIMAIMYRSCTITILRSVKTIKISLLVYSVALVVNIFLNWVLIFGNLGFPALGVAGAAIATVLSRCSEILVILIFMSKFESKIKFKFKHLKLLDKLMFKDFIKVSTPIILNDFFWAIGASMICIIVARMGPNVVAANSINNVVNQFATLFIHGLSSASSVIIGNTGGEGDKKKVMEYANAICVLSIFMGILAGLTIYFLRPIAVNLYNISDDTKAIACEIMIATSIVSIFRALSANILMGILRGGGDNRFIFLLEMSFLWFISIPPGFIAAFVLKLPIVLVFLIIRSDEILKSFIGAFRVIRGKWIYDVTRDF